jgi:predicted outer membrane repeat protein
LVLALSATPLTPSVRAVGATTWIVAHHDEILDYADGSTCADPDFWTDGSWSEPGSGDGAYDSDEDAIQDAIDNAASGDTIYVCFGRYEFDTDLHNIDPGMDLTIVGDGIGDTVLDGTDSTRLINANPVGEDDDGGTLTLQDLSMDDARTESVFDNGGAVNADGLSLTRVSISGSDNAYNGGALYAEGNVTIADSTFTDNDTSEYGAVVYAWNPARTVSISNSVIDGNDSGKGGGAINATTVTVTGSTFTDNNAVIDGGAIKATTVTVTGSTFTDNDADDDGGAIYADTVTVTGSTFTDNDADGSSGGGAILAYTATVTDSTFTNNTADSYGGAISAYITTATGSSFTDNTANSGGAINTYTATVTGSSFTNNSSTIGGAIYATTATVSNSTFRDNTAYLGGAICADSTATVSNSTFRGNTAVFNGGAIFSTTNTVTSSTFTSNSAVIGGAIRADTATVSNSTFTSNTSNEGGAISASTGVVAGSRFTRNTSGTHGGAIYFGSPAPTDLNLMRRNTFSRNTAPAGGAMTLGPCGTPSRSQAARVERANRFSGNRATGQRLTNNIERLTGACA